MASCRVFFNDRRQGIPLYFMYTGPKPLSGEKTYAEFRLDGPYTRKVSGSEKWYDIEINVLSTTHVEVSKTDDIEDINGIWLAAFEDAIPVYKFGNRPGDDKSFIGCLVLQQQAGKAVHLNRFGQSNPDTRMIQTSVEGHYRMKARS